MVFHMTLSKKKNTEDLDSFILSYKRDVPNFYDEGESEVLHVPVEDGVIRVYHHKPKMVKTKRPIIFIPGFGTTLQSWRDFHKTHHGFAEYYHIETRDKKSGQIRRHIKVDLTIDRIAKDIANVIEFVGLTDQKYVIVASCMNGGVLLHGLIKEYFNPSTAIVFDPFTKWTQYRFFVKLVMPVFPPFLLGALKFIIGKIIMANMKNEAQKERNIDMLESAVPWKWRKFSLQNVNFDLTDEMKKISNEVFVFHGPLDKFHPDEVFRNVAKRMPKGRYFFMKTSEENRELLVGVIATLFSSISEQDGVPDDLVPYEVNLNRELDLQT